MTDYWKRQVDCDFCGRSMTGSRSVHLMQWLGHGFMWQRPYPTAIEIDRDAVLSFEPVCRDCYDYIVAEVLTLGDELRRRRNGSHRSPYEQNPLLNSESHGKTDSISRSEERGRRST